MKYCTAAVLTILIGISPNALASLITLEYQARIDSSSLPSIPVGTILTGQYTFDDAQPDQNSSPFQGSYDFMFGSITFAGMNYTMSPSPTVTPNFIHDPFTSIVVQSFVEDYYAVTSILSGPTLDGFIPNSIFFQLYSDPGEGINAFDNDAIVVSSIPVANFASNSFALTFGSGSNSVNAYGDILSIEPVVVAVPVSDTATLLGFALFGVLVLRRRSDGRGCSSGCVATSHC